MVDGFPILLKCGRFTNIKNVAIRREWQVLRGQEDKKFFTVRFNAAGARDRGFLVKFSGKF